MLYRLKFFTKKNLNWLCLAVAFYLLGFALTFFALENVPNGSELIFQQLEQLEDLAQEIFSVNPLYGIVRLFIHNTTASFSIIIFSFIIGLPPLLSLLGNGSMLGIIAVLMSQSDINFLPFLFYGIVPHGIFELPAFFISAALGLKVGYHIIFPLPDKGRIESIKEIWKEIMYMAPTILALLLIAAIIEVLITPGILSHFFPTYFNLP